MDGSEHVLLEDSQAAQASSVANLAELISSRKDERGWTYQQLADRAHGVISRQRWQQLGTGTRIKEFPEPNTMQSISDALEVDITLVVLAVARSIGLDVRSRDSALAAMLPPGAAFLTTEQRDAILAVVRVMSPSRGVTNEDTSTQTPAGNQEADGEAGDPRTPTTRAADGGDADNVHALNRRKQGSTPAPDFANPGEYAAAREEPGYIKSGKRDRGFDEDHSSE